MSAQRGGCLQDDKLGEYSADCGDAAHVGGAGEDGSVEHGGAPACRQPRRGESVRPACGRLLHNLVPHYVHKQHGNGGAHVADSAHFGYGYRRKSLPYALRRDARRKHVLRIAVFYSA